eukprot:GILI01041974.1.p1 GENE.GILI01041974.1~~GILI01041974.1.p1  ORF type:complete len:161 (-),score=10.91 GILI01041974.1:194-676(-)
MSLDIITAIIVDPRCGLERRSTESDWFLSYNPSETSRLGNPMRSVHGVDGYTPLFLAVIHCRNDVRTLLAMEADVNAVTMDGSTLLHVAALYGHTAFVELLIVKGVDVKASGNVNAVDRAAVIRRSTLLALPVLSYSLLKELMRRRLAMTVIRRYIVRLI